MTDKVKQILEQVEDVLLQQNTDSAQLWDLLGAVRGPDDENQYAVKLETTARIRAAMFPRLARDADAYFKLNAVLLADVPVTEPTAEERARWTSKMGIHFTSHACRAMKAILSQD